MMSTTFRSIILTALTFWAWSCAKEDPNPQPEPQPQSEAIRGADLSFLPEIEAAGTVFYNAQGQAEDVLTTLKNAGCNTVRIRLWKDPQGSTSSLAEVKTFAEKVKAKGLKVWLCVHYSDTWADPGQQTTPKAWQNLSFALLKDSLSAYTRKIASEIQPEYIQIGNEINSGFLWPQGEIKNQSAFLELLQAGCKAVRESSAKSQIILHFAGLTGADWFFNLVGGVDYDLMGLSYYPTWHGKDPIVLETAFKNLAYLRKDIVVAETAYPFTLGWKDFTNNIVGSEDQLARGFAATPEGQAQFLAEIHRIATSTNRGKGFCYWGGEWVAFKGDQATDGSPWENQALYDFTNKALPVLSSFAKK
ncbi:MAG: glycosyl hydrolase 53 family protein [Haliscomenobacter sp.]|nr:glycosyl hydrolase 53 family protein [Haliscomenobacter sp.]